MGDYRVDRRADGSWRVESPDARIHTAHAVTGADGAIWVQVDGNVIRIHDESEQRPRPRVHGHATLEPPMPAQVTAVFVKPGDDVDAGTTLLVLEAMKMELPLKAPAAGRVASVHCKAGDRVTPGRSLVDLVNPEAEP